MSKYKVIFFGTPEIAVSSLRSLAQIKELDIINVVTMPDRPAGRGKKLVSPAIAEEAIKLNIPLIQTSNINGEKAILAQWEKEKPDIIIVFAFAQFLNDTILKLPKLGCFNIHTSLLPKYRGAAPIQYAILNNDAISGISIQKMVKKMDAGDIAFTQSAPIGPDETAQELYDKLKYLAAESLPQFIERLLTNQIHYKPQDEKFISFAPSIEKSQGHINFSKENFRSLYNKLRAFTPWPGIYTYLNGKRLKILEVEKDPTPLEVNQISVNYKTLLVACLDTTVRLKKIQLEGKKPCTDTELLNGLMNKEKTFILK